VADAHAGYIGEEIFQAASPSGRIGLGLPDGYISRGDCFNCQGQSDHPCEFGFAIGFGEQQHAGIQAAMMDDGVLGISRREQRLESGAPLQRLVDQSPAVHVAGHDHVGEQQIDGPGIIDDPGDPIDPIIWGNSIVWGIDGDPGNDIIWGTSIVWGVDDSVDGLSNDEDGED